jgi:hypothetical protein
MDMLPPSSGLNMKPSKKTTTSRWQAKQAGLLLGLISNPQSGSGHVTLKRHMIFNILQCHNPEDRTLQCHCSLTIICLSKLKKQDYKM